MQKTSVEALIQALNAAGVRYLIVGGLAVVAHGYVRFTADVDVVLDLAGDNPRRAVTALDGLGYRPRAPVALAEFADAAKRDIWIREKQLTVFSLYSPEHLATEVDLFVQSPFNFAEAYARAARIEVAQGVAATFVGLEDLIALKQQVGRPQDALDVQQLKALRKDHADDA